MISREQIPSLLKEHGIRPTRHRVRIAEFLFHESDHPSAEQVHDWARQNLSQVSRATVYNTLNELVAAGLIKQVHLAGESRSVFDCNTGLHFHFLDVNSGRIFDLEPGSVKLDLKKLRGFQVSDVDIVLKGRRTS